MSPCATGVGVVFATPHSGWRRATIGARLVVSSSTPGAAFTALASVIDETTNDPTTIEAR